MSAPYFKVVICSHVSYETARQYMLQSLRGVGFPMSDVIVVVAGAGREECDVSAVAQGGPVTLLSQYNAYDGTHVAVIRRFLDHPDVDADAYVVLHDCGVVAPGFPKKARDMAARLLKNGLDALHATTDRSLGLVCLSRSFYARFGPHYSLDLPAGTVPPYARLAGEDKTSQLPNCTPTLGPARDTYGTGVFRHTAYISSLNVQKFVAAPSHGGNGP